MTLGQLLNSHRIFKRLAKVAHTTLLEISCRGSNIQPRLTFMGYVIIYEPVHEISNNLVCATSKASDQPAHMRSLIRAFACRLSIL